MKLSVFFKGALLTLGLFSFSSMQAYSAESLMAVKAKDSLLLDVQQLSNGRLVAVGERGHILISDDQGNNWQQQSVPTQNTLTALDFYDDKWGVAVGYEQVVLITKDGGDTWNLTHSAEDVVEYPALFDVEFVELNTIIAVGAFGLYLESDDGGDSWKEREVESLADFYGGFSHFYGLTHQEGSQNIYLAGEKFVANESEDGEEISAGLIAVSNDRGKTWTKLSSAYDGSYFGVDVAPDNSLFVYGLKGNIYRSTNQGVSWQNIKLNSSSGIHDIEFIDDRWFAVGTGGLLISQENQSIAPRDDLKGRAALVSIGNEQLVIVGEGGTETINLPKAKAASN